jgi:crotonobetainyl-CoA:carnitine CoA-transferase CaiB-like acyl-CoA transferase
MLRRVIQFSTAAPRQATRATTGRRLEVAPTGAHNRSVLANFGYNENAIATQQRSGALREYAG